MTKISSVILRHDNCHFVTSLDQLVSAQDLVTTQQRINRTNNIPVQWISEYTLPESMKSLFLIVSFSHTVQVLVLKIPGVSWEQLTSSKPYSWIPDFQVHGIRSWHCGTSAHKVGHQREQRKWNTVSNLIAHILCRGMIPSSSWSMDFCFCAEWEPHWAGVLRASASQWAKFSILHMHPKAEELPHTRAVECSEHSKPEANMLSGKAAAFKTWMEPLLLSKSQIFPTPTSWEQVQFPTSKVAMSPHGAQKRSVAPTVHKAILRGTSLLC